MSWESLRFAAVILDQPESFIVVDFAGDYMTYGIVRGTSPGGFPTGARISGSYWNWETGVDADEKIGWSHSHLLTLANLNPQEVLLARLDQPSNDHNTSGALIQDQIGGPLDDETIEMFTRFKADALAKVDDAGVQLHQTFLEAVREYIAANQTGNEP